MVKKVKSLLKSLINNQTFPIISGPLKGVKLRVDPLIQGVYFFKPYEPDKQYALSQYLRKDSIFFDVGANVGMHSLYAFKSFPGIKIYSFEPLPKNIQYFRETIQRNKLHDIHIIPKAVGAFTGKIYFEEGVTNLQGKITEAKTSLEIDIITLDDFITNSGKYPDVIKVDVEGAEIDVLNGALKLIKSKPPIWIIELHNQEQCRLVSEFFSDKNFKLLRLVENSQHPSIVPISKPLAYWPDSDGVHGNIVAVPY